jgi:hypothetical protein
VIALINNITINSSLGIIMSAAHGSAVARQSAYVCAPKSAYVCAPTLLSNATTSTSGLLVAMAHLRGVLPSLQEGVSGKHENNTTQNQ